jgi:hypothetical protein
MDQLQQLSPLQRLMARLVSKQFCKVLHGPEIPQLDVSVAERIQSDCICLFERDDGKHKVRKILSGLRQQTHLELLRTTRPPTLAAKTIAFVWRRNKFPVRSLIQLDSDRFTGNIANRYSDLGGCHRRQLPISRPSALNQTSTLKTNLHKFEICDSAFIINGRGRGQCDLWTRPWRNGLHGQPTATDVRCKPWYLSITI